MATKKRKYDSKTPSWQRLAIWVIAIVMAGGTLLTFMVMVFAGQNSDLDASTIAAQRQQQEYKDYLESDEYKELLKSQEEAAANYRALDGFADRVASFDADDVTELTVETLKEGDGATIATGATISANYTLWTPDGKIVQSTKSEGSDATPISDLVIEEGSVIEGWSTGLIGARAGGVYLLTIPSDQAYGQSGTSSIPANTPLKFIVQVVSVS